MCSQINHFPEDADYDQDAAEYLLRESKMSLRCCLCYHYRSMKNIALKCCVFSGVVRASSIFPILSAILLLLGGVCVASSRFYKTKRHIILGAGILFVVAGNVSSDHNKYGYDTKKGEFIKHLCPFLLTTQNTVNEI